MALLPNAKSTWKVACIPTFLGIGVTNFIYLFTNARHLVGLACTTWTGVSREPDSHDDLYYNYDMPRSTMTYLPHHDVSRSVMARARELLLYNDVRTNL